MTATERTLAAVTFALFFAAGFAAACAVMAGREPVGYLAPAIDRAADGLMGMTTSDRIA